MNIRIPIVVLDGGGKKSLEKAGVKFLGVTEDNPIFQRVELPDGWREEENDHGYFILDTKNRARIWVVSSIVIIIPSHTLNFKYENGCGKTTIRNSNGEIIYTTPSISSSSLNPEMDLIDETGKIALKWLDKNRPEWKDNSKYWD